MRGCREVPATSAHGGQAFLRAGAGVGTEKWVQVLSVHPAGEAAGVGAERMRLNRTTSLRAVNLLKFPAVPVEPG